MTTIQHAIGPTFGEELAALNLPGASLVFNATYGTVTYDETALSAPQITALQAMVAAHDPTQQIAIPAPWPTSLGWSLGIQPGDQLALAKMAGIIATAQNALTGDDLTAFLAQNVTMKDTDGGAHTVTITQAQQLLLGYGLYCQGLWAAGTLPS